MAPRAERALVSVCLLVAALVVALLQPVGAASAASPVPVPPTLPVAIEPLAGYQGAQLCDPVARTGVNKLKSLLAATYSSTSFGITRACSGTTATSEHMEGRALDWMISGATQKANAQAFLAWLLKSDAAGNPQAMARRMGIMYIVWDDRMFRLYDTGRGWSEYQGCSATQAASYDTTCHRNHVHFSLSWDGAAGKTSYWSGSAVTAPNCPEVGGVAVPAALAKTGLELMPLPPFRLLDTAGTIGVSTRCRLAQDSDPDQRIDVQVSGRGGVPPSATAVVLSVQVRGPNAPLKLYVEPTGSTAPRLRVSTTAMNVNGLGSMTVPLGSGGRVSLTLPTGASDVSVDVLGYYASPDAVTSLFHPGAPVRVLDTWAAATVLAPGETRTLDLSGRAGLPSAGATAVTLSATVSNGSASGGVTLFGGADTAPSSTLLSVYAPAGRVRTNLVLARVAPNGTITVRNDTTGTRHLRLDVLGWWAPASVAGGSRYVPLAPSEVIDTTENKGVTGAMTAGRVATPALAGVGGVPTAGVTAVALQATALAPTADTGLLVWRAGEANPATRSASPRLGVDHTAFLVAPLASGKTSFSNTVGTVGLRAYAVGYWYLP